MKILIAVTSLMILLAVSGAQTSETHTETEFQSVTIESHPKGWGYAQKTVLNNGMVTGGHLSGGPNLARVYESKLKLKYKDKKRLKKLVAKLRHSATENTSSNPDQKVQGYTSVIIIFSENEMITEHAKWGEKFDSPDIQAIWDIIHKYKAGAW